MAILEVFVGGTSLIASADQLHRIWTSRDKQISEKRASSSEQEDASNLILRAAKSHQGRLTAAEIAAATNLHYKVAAKHLEEMAEDGSGGGGSGGDGALNAVEPTPSQAQTIKGEVQVNSDGAVVVVPSAA